MSELRPEWTCVDCAVRVYDACGKPIPKPLGWAGGRCQHCRVNEVRKTEGKKAVAELEESLRRAREGRKGTAKSGRASNSRAESERRKEQVRVAHLEHPNWTPGQIAKKLQIPRRTVNRYFRDLGLSEPKSDALPNLARIELALKETIESDRDIARALGVEYVEVRDARKRLGIANYKERLHARRREQVAAVVGEHPEWTNRQVADEIGDPNVPVGKIRRELDLPRYAQGKRFVNPLAA
jgi:AraC-like DNA-binding protein